MTVISYDEARNQGMTAFEEGAGPNDNPYERGTHMYFGWNEGWDFASFCKETS
jgi:hypothetical protein